MATFHHSVKSGKKGSARRHACYIERLGAHGVHSDLIHSGYGNMPAWAEMDPNMFWGMADRYERSNGSAYREHEIALPNGLTPQQLIALAERLVRALAGSKPYHYAIHSPEGKLEGIHNPHIHLMISDRVPDGLDRSPQQTFSRFNAKQPEAGGRRKDSGGRSPAELSQQVTATRMLVAQTQNQFLADHGYHERVDHRSLRDQGLKRQPERHLGQRFVKDMAHAEREQYVLCRRSLGAASAFGNR
ncbi:MobA/MobL family protein [Stenotrophomonas sp. NPDC078853]